MRSLALVALLAACSTDIGAQQETACALIETHTYETPTAFECGIGPNGPQTCIWHISFDTAEFKDRVAQFRGRSKT